jgi:type IV secretory pathway VirB10-like protein
MANSINSGKGGASNSRSRMLVIVTVVVLIVAAVIGFIGLRGSESTQDSAARLAAIPGIQSIPGSDKAAAQYVQTVQKSNQIEAKEALQKGSSSIPTILRSSTFETGSFSEAGGGYGNSCEHIQNKFPYCFSSVGADNQGLGIILPQIAQACRPGVSPSNCRGAIDKLVQDKRLTKEEGDRLFNAYTQTSSENPAVVIQSLLKDGMINQKQAQDIEKECHQQGSASAGKGEVSATNGGTSTDNCASLLQGLVATGKLSSAESMRLMQAYARPIASDPSITGAIKQSSNAALKEGGGLSSSITKVPAVEALVNSGLITTSAAQGIQQACKKEGNDIACSDYLKKMVSDGKLTGSQASNLLVAYDKPPVDFSSKNSLEDSPSDQGIPGIDGGDSAQLNQVVARQQAFIKDQTNKQKIQEAESAMQSQAAALFQAWYPPPLQTVTEGTLVDGSAKNQGGNASAPADQGLAAEADDTHVETFKAGKIIFGMLNTQINSDQPGPVLASIVGGPLNGAKLLGTMAREDDKLLLRFTLISLDKAKTSGQVNIVAVSPETARTALASSVDRHYLSRYGSLFASSFIQGFGQAVQQSGQTTSSGINGTVTTQPATTTKEKMLIAFGDTAQKMGDNLSAVINRQPTVILNAGSSIGLLFLSDFKVNKDLLKHSTIQGIEDLNTES